MRCPKCGYITFDHLDICPKCKKNISEIPEQLSGTVFNIEAPAFFKFDVNESVSGLESSESESSSYVPVDEEDIEFDMMLDEDNNELDMEFSFAEEKEDIVKSQDSPGNEVEAEAVDDIEGDYTDDNEVVPVSAGSGDDELSSAGEEDFSEFDFVLGEDENTDGEDIPQLDFSELDITDLAPPADEENNSDIEELTLDNSDEYEQTSVHSPVPKQGPGTGLEDLETDGLNMDLLAAVRSSGQNLRFDVRTGTALDDFNIDLGELMSENEK